MDAPSHTPDAPPLVALLGASHDVFEAEFNRRIKDSEFCSLSLAHSRNVLRHLARGPARAAHLVSQCGITKQAISQQLAHLERNGYVAVVPDPTDHRARMVSLTEKGSQARCLVARLFAEIEADWGARVGPEDLERVRRVLVRLASPAERDPGSEPAAIHPEPTL